MNPAEQNKLRDTKYWWIIWVRHSKLITSYGADDYFRK